MDNGQSIRMQNLLREKVLYRYINALARGDIDTIEAVFQESEKDELLERMIADVHRLYRMEEDAAAYASDAAFVCQLLLQHQESGHTATQLAPLEQGNVLLADPRTVKSTFFKRLRDIGLDKDFVMQRLLPKSLAVKLQGQKVSEETTAFVMQAANVIEQVFNWEPGILFRSTPLPLDTATVGTTRFKRNVDSDIERIRAYTIYAHRLARIVLQATENLPRKSIPTDPGVVRRAVLEAYGTFTFEHVLQYVWSLGIPVLPLHDKGVFHGACWRIDHRNVIVLKQQTMSDTRWLFDLLHEFRHAGQDPEQEEFEVIEASDTSQEHQLTEEEKTASRFAGNVILEGRAEELVQICVQAANGSVELLKKVVPIIARREHVPTGALANYMAFRLSLQQLNWWGAANNLQEPGADAWRISQDVLLRQANFEVLDEPDRNLLLRALSDAEV